MANFQDIIGAFRDKPGGIIEAYHALQKEFNYIPKPAVAKRPGFLGFRRPRRMEWQPFIRIWRRSQEVSI